jgi:hypothetical protein
MVTPLTRSGLHGFLGLALAMSLCAAPFVPPKEGPVAFRRDRLPIDVDTMISLSDELLTLANGQKLETAEDRRNVARILALSSALNPANTAARDTAAKLASGETLPKPEKREINRSQARIWHTLAWLQMPEAGADGLALGSCLGDVISFADPDHPRASALREAGERGAWKEWIAETPAFEDTQLAGNEKVGPSMPMDPQAPPTPVPGEKAQLLLDTTTIVTPLWITSKSTDLGVLQPVAVKMTASTVPQVEGVPPAAPMTFSVDQTLEKAPVNRLNRDLQTVLIQRFGKLPADSQLVLSLGEQVSSSPIRDREVLSGAAAVLLGSALSGQEPEAVIIGKIDPSGSFKSVPDFWDRLRAVAKGPGGRLVIPAEAEEMLPSILAMEEPEFFLKYDVFLASNLTELLDRSAKTPAAPMAEMLARFQDVRAKSVGQPVGPYVANRFVRQRLIFLANEASYYASPRMLAIQAAGERPTRIPRKILSFELQRAIRPIAWIQGKTSADIDVAELDKSYDLARAEVDKLERYAESADKDFLNRVRDMTTTLRTYSRASRVGINRENGPAIVAAAFEAMRKSYASVLLELKTATGEKDPAEDVEPSAQ